MTRLQFGLTMNESYGMRRPYLMVMKHRGTTNFLGVVPLMMPAVGAEGFRCVVLFGVSFVGA